MSQGHQSQAPGVSTPEPTRLYHLEPLGMCSPLVESLVSYMARLAAAHCVSPMQLIMSEIAPRVGKRYATTVNAGQRFLANWRHILALCGSGPIAREWAYALEQLTGWDSLAPLTLVHLNHFVSAPTPGTLRRERAWCPMCFEEWRRADATSYTPLTWMIQQVTHCPIHHSRLVATCPNTSCGRPGTWSIGQYHQARCAHCDTWLGELAHGNEGSTASESNQSLRNLTRGNSRSIDEQEQCLISDVIGILLSIPESQVVTSAALMRQGLAHVMSAVTPERFKSLRRQTGVTPHVVETWANGTSRPSLRQVLGVCRMLEISMPALLGSR